MANPLSTGVRLLPSFNRLNLPDQLAVRLKAEGRSYARIAAELDNTYGYARSEESIRDWFRPDGRLAAAYAQYTDYICTESLKTAQTLLMRLTLPAVATLSKLLEHPNPYIQLGAAKAIIDKTIPDANVVASGKHAPEPELPDALQEAMDKDDGWLNVLDEVRKDGQRTASHETHRFTPNLM